jgi:hypothetical protein
MPTDDFIAFCFIVFVILRKAPQRVETRVICQRRAAASQAMECIQPTGARLQGGVVEFDPGMLSDSNHSAQIRFQIGNRRALPLQRYTRNNVQHRIGKHYTLLFIFVWGFLLTRVTAHRR